MKKIMFNDKYFLTQAVLNRKKTMTRRIAYSKNIRHQLDIGYDTKTHQCLICDGEFVVARSRYYIGEVVAIGQSYETLANSGYIYEMMDCMFSIKKEYIGAGWKNKMFVKADLMPHHIKITNIRVERLQDISDEDCLREGIFKDPMCYGFYERLKKNIYTFVLNNPREAFAILIDKISGKGTWYNNPLVYVYEFELID